VGFVPFVVILCLVSVPCSTSGADITRFAGVDRRATHSWSILFVYFGRVWACWFTIGHGNRPRIVIMVRDQTSENLVAFHCFDECLRRIYCQFYGAIQSMGRFQAEEHPSPIFLCVSASLRDIPWFG